MAQHPQSLHFDCADDRHVALAFWLPEGCEELTLELQATEGHERVSGAVDVQSSQVMSSYIQFCRMKLIRCGNHRNMFCSSAVVLQILIALIDIYIVYAIYSIYHSVIRQILQWLLCKC